MDKKERQEIERQRRETALKNTFFQSLSSFTLFNRTLLFWQYLLAFKPIYSTFSCYDFSCYTHRIFYFSYC